jgi:hypothetical protein
MDNGHLWLRILAAWLPGPVSGSPIAALPSGSHHPGVPLSPFSFVQGGRRRVYVIHGLINPIDGNAYLKNLLAPLKRKTRDVFSGIVCSSAHLGTDR